MTDEGEMDRNGRASLCSSPLLIFVNSSCRGLNLLCLLSYYRCFYTVISFLLTDLPSWVTGGVVEAGSQGCGETDRIQVSSESEQGALRPLHRFPQPLQPGDGIRGSGHVSDPVHEGQQGSYRVIGFGSQPSEEAARVERPAVPLYVGELADQTTRGTVSQGRPFFDPSSSSVTYGYWAGDHQDNGLVGPGTADQSYPAAYVNPMSSTLGGNYEFSPGWGFCVQNQRAYSGDPHPPYQDMYDGGGGICGAGRQRQRDFGIQAFGAPFCYAGSPQKAHRIRVLHGPKGAAVSGQALLKGGFQRSN